MSSITIAMLYIKVWESKNYVRMSMTSINNSKSISNDASVEHQWMQWVVKSSDPRFAIRTFAKHYHYFSINQVVAFSRLLATIPRTDRESMALFAEVLFEELGSGKHNLVHSIIFERFAKAAGIDPGELPLKPGQVAPGVRWYVCELEMAFGGNSLPRALATYCFLESSAVATYGPLLETLRSLGFSETELDFFIRHSEIEIEHSKAAHQLVERAHLSSDQMIEYHDQTLLLDKCWKIFWTDIWKECQEARK